MKTAIITGAAQGIGRAIARRLAHDGFSVAIADQDEARAAETAHEIEVGGGTAFSVALDVSDSSSVNRMTSAVLARFGSVEALINNAGIAGPPTPVQECSEENWRRVLAVDLDGVFFCCKAVLPGMLARGSGRIVNIASIAGKEGNPSMAAYSAAKAGVIGFTKALGKEVATSGIYVNCVTPAVIATDILKQVTEETIRYMTSKIPMGRIGQPEEVAALVSWLCSDECTFSTGAIFDLSGGRATY